MGPIDEPRRQELKGEREMTKGEITAIALMTVCGLAIGIGSQMGSKEPGADGKPTPAAYMDAEAEMNARKSYISRLDDMGGGRWRVRCARGTACTDAQMNLAGGEGTAGMFQSRVLLAQPTLAKDMRAMGFDTITFRGMDGQTTFRLKDY
jgi:hypothetical protein